MNPKAALRILLFLLVAYCFAKAEQQRDDERIHLDVVVTDVEGKPVPGLDASNFAVFDDGKQQDLATFSAFDPLVSKPAPATQMIIIIDTLNSGFVEMGYMRQGLEGFLRENGGRLGQLTTLVRLDPTGIKALSQPSRDGNALASIVREMGATVKPRGLDTLLVSINALVGLAKEELSEPGRKVVVWLGPGWATPALPRGTLTPADERNQRAYYAVSVQLQKLLHDGRMVLYGGSASGEFYMRDYLKPVKRVSDLDAGMLQLNVLAIKSGGKGELPEINRDRAVTEVLDHCAAETNSYYSLSFDPPNARQADDFHELRVAVNRPGLTARTILGYYNQPHTSRHESPKQSLVIAHEAAPKEEFPRTPVTVKQLREVIDAVKGKGDGEATLEIEQLQLKERLSSAGLAVMINELKGERARAALRAIADASVFLQLPANEVSAGTPPSLIEQRRIVSLAVEYLRHAVPKLPNFIAQRTTITFETSGVPKNREAAQRDVPFKRAGEQVATVFYRQGKEIVQPIRSKNAETQPSLTTAGIFGPVLSTVIVDASHGEMKWSHWEPGPNGPMAVFEYRVAQSQSHYVPSYSAVAKLFGDVSNVSSAYHGEVGIDPSTGAIFRLTLEADLALESLLRRADIMVEYGKVEIGGTSYTCPLRSVSVSTGRASSDPVELTSGNARDVTTLNDDVFDQYHVFRSEMRVVPD